ncbi:DNA mismatch repair protein MutT [Erysipelothrix larvae]|uniref:DNA mismatch repair protein MutT n=1 Tax=Erysipelothrix larvae TaxID=1514105 RepID=A0A120JTH0_9FIRM|nr:8-oxo-dGTP diphosphatase [Erysipelothrix larvae]AMC92836.1 DNA mismatch repair protein MutT [Erysipelothrix larvae]
MRTEVVTLTNMCMIEDGDKILVLNKTGENDPEYVGLTFPGGHIERGESLVDSAIREVKEETGLDIDNVVLCGVKHFPTDNGRYIVFFFRTNSFSGVLKSSNEGEVFWIKKANLTDYQLSVDFEEMVNIFTGEKSEFYYYLEENEWKFDIK